MAQYYGIFRQAVLYALVGGTSLLIDVTITTILFNTFGFPAYLASAIGFLSAFFFNFPVNRKKVFRHEQNHRFNLRTQLTMFLSLSIFNLLATSVLVDMLVNNNILTIGYAKIVIAALIVCWNFALLKLVIFGSTRKVEAQ